MTYLSAAGSLKAKRARTHKHVVLVLDHERRLHFLISRLVGEWKKIRGGDNGGQIWYASQKKYNCYVICGRKR